MGEIRGRLFDDRRRDCASEPRDRVVHIGLGALRGCDDMAAVVSGSSRSRVLREAIGGSIMKSIVIDQAVGDSLLCAA